MGLRVLECDTVEVIYATVHWLSYCESYALNNLLVVSRPSKCYRLLHSHLILYLLFCKMASLYCVLNKIHSQIFLNGINQFFKPILDSALQTITITQFHTSFVENRRTHCIICTSKTQSLCLYICTGL